MIEFDITIIMTFQFVYLEKSQKKDVKITNSPFVFSLESNIDEKRKLCT